MSAIYSSARLGDSVLTVARWRDLSDEQRAAIEALVAPCGITTDGPRLVVTRSDRHGTHVEGYLSRTVIDEVRS